MALQQRRANGLLQKVLRRRDLQCRALTSEEDLMPYVDGYVLPVSRRKLQQYRKIARMSGRIWKKYGALQFRECVGDDLNVKFGRGFRPAVRLKPGETVLFSWIVFKSRAHR